MYIYATAGLFLNRFHALNLYAIKMPLDGTQIIQGVQKTFQPQQLEADGHTSTFGQI